MPRLTHTIKRLATLLEDRGDLVEALAWYESAGELGHAGAANFAGSYYLSRGTQYDRASRLLKIASDAGIAGAAIGLALLADARGDIAESRRYLLDAAEQGQTDALVRLAVMAHEGRGEPQSHQRFIELLMTAKAGGDSATEAMLDMEVPGCLECIAAHDERQRRADEFRRTHVRYGDKFIAAASLDFDHYEGDDADRVAEDMRLRPYFVCANQGRDKHLWRKDALFFSPRYLGYRRTLCNDCYRERHPR